MVQFAQARALADCIAVMPPNFIRQLVLAVAVALSKVCGIAFAMITAKLIYQDSDTVCFGGCSSPQYIVGIAGWHCKVRICHVRWCGRFAAHPPLWLSCNQMQWLCTKLMHDQHTHSRCVPWKRNMLLTLVKTVCLQMLYRWLQGDRLG